MNRIDFARDQRRRAAGAARPRAALAPQRPATRQRIPRLNPNRADRRPGSFSINVRTGRWCDFATGDRGGDPVSLAAYLFNLSQVDAARRLAGMLGLPENFR